MLRIINEIKLIRDKYDKARMLQQLAADSFTFENVREAFYRDYKMIFENDEKFPANLKGHFKAVISHKPNEWMIDEPSFYGDFLIPNHIEITDNETSK